MTYEITSMEPYSAFEGYWFYMLNADKALVYYGDKPVATIDTQDRIVFRYGTYDAVDAETAKTIERLFCKWMDSNRPEFAWVKFKHQLEHCRNSGHPLPQGQELIETYKSILTGVCLARAWRNNPGQDLDESLPSCKRILEWLETGTDFFTTPASSRFHESYPHGLVEHHLKVIEQIIDLMDVPKFRTVRAEDAILVAAVHDWCKIGLYEQYEKNVKNEQGVWEKQTAYKYKDEGSAFPFGHGETSMYLASKFIRLSKEEALAIRWHMGRWHASTDQMSDLQHSNENFPLVLMLQFADQLAVTKY